MFPTDCRSSWSWLNATLLLICLPLLTFPLFNPCHACAEGDKGPAFNTWSEGLGGGEHGQLGFRFKVSWLRIDVADIEALLTPTAAGVLGIVLQNGDEGERALRVAATIMAADTVAFRFTFLKGGGIGRFIDGVRTNLDAARREGLIDGDEFTLVSTGFREIMGSLGEGGNGAGDQLLYRIEGDDLRLIYLGADGEILFDVTRSAAGWARGIKGTFLAAGSSFSEKLIRSLWDD